MRSSIFGLTIAPLMLFFLCGCNTVAITGRTQLNVISDSELIASANQNFAQFMNAANSKGAIMKSTDSPEAANAINVVNRVSNKIIDAAGLRSKYDWQVSVIKSNVANAFVMPNGKIVVYTGILPVVKTEAGLAAVIGHEVAHVVAHHSAERASQVRLTKTVINTLDAAAAAKNPENRALMAAALGLGAQYGILLPYSRSHESEADRIGQIYMAKAGYDPAEAIAVWVRMAANSKQSRLEFSSTHPSEVTRQVQLKQWLPEAQMYYVDRARALPSNLTEIRTARIEAEEKNALAPIAFQPEINEGYWYKARALLTGNETNYQYKKYETCDAGNCMMVSSSTNTKRILTSDFRIVSQENQNGMQTKFTPPLQQIKFPLKVGTAWEDVVEVGTSDGKKRSAMFKSQVVAYEPVAVPAGNFMGYKIITSTNGVKASEVWYVSEVRGLAKATSFGAQGESVTVLIDFQKSDDIAGDFSTSK